MTTFVKLKSYFWGQMEKKTYEISIRDLRKFFPDNSGEDLPDDFFIAVVRYADSAKIFQIISHPCRLDGFMAIFCIKGRLEVEINLKKYSISDNSVIINIPGNIARVEKADYNPSEDLNAVIVAASREFLSDSKMDYVHMFNESMALLDNPCFVITDDELGIFKKYFELSSALMNSDSQNKKQSLNGLVSSCLNYAGAIWSKKISEAQNPHAGKEKSMRSKIILEQFLKLVTEFHNSQRGMSFYAEKLYLTPKYLSKIIKEASGRTGPEWIDSFVIMEAKNMLRYSDMPIKEVVFELHFPNSSVFYKFFKLHTGQTPSEYRKLSAQNAR